jgi:endonuclease/exonuclease/phosphatase family metal-dependent hydrolase
VALKFMLWNMEWMNDLFVPDSQAVAFRPDGEATAHDGSASVKTRRTHLAGVINEVAADVVVIVEGPSRPAELQLFFDTDVTGTWNTHLKTTSGQQQNIGVAVRVDTGKFAAQALSALTWPDATAFAPFLADTDNDDVEEHHKFERQPLYAEVKTAAGPAFRILGLHLKSKGIFDAFEWARWWDQADANRKKILAQATQIRLKFVDKYLSDAALSVVPLMVCGDINDGPGFDASERRLLGSGIERLMGNVWRPGLCLGNALFDTLTDKQKTTLDFSSLATTSFKDPIFNNVYQREWIDHILYTGRAGGPWVTGAEVVRKMPDGQMIWTKYKHASDHQPVTCQIAL